MQRQARQREQMQHAEYERSYSGEYQEPSLPVRSNNPFGVTSATVRVVPVPRPPTPSPPRVHLADALQLSPMRPRPPVQRQSQQQPPHQLFAGASTETEPQLQRQGARATNTVPPYVQQRGTEAVKRKSAATEQGKQAQTPENEEGGEGRPPAKKKQAERRGPGNDESGEEAIFLPAAPNTTRTIAGPSTQTAASGAQAANAYRRQLNAALTALLNAQPQTTESQAAAAGLPVHIFRQQRLQYARSAVNTDQQEVLDIIQAGIIGRAPRGLNFVARAGQYGFHDPNAPPGQQPNQPNTVVRGTSAPTAGAAAHLVLRLYGREWRWRLGIIKEPIVKHSHIHPPK